MSPFSSTIIGCIVLLLAGPRMVIKKVKIANWDDSPSGPNKESTQNLLGEIL